MEDSGKEEIEMTERNNTKNYKIERNSLADDHARVDFADNNNDNSSSLEEAATVNKDNIDDSDDSKDEECGSPRTNANLINGLKTRPISIGFDVTPESPQGSATPAFFS